MKRTPAELLDIELAAAIGTLTAESVEPYTDSDAGWRKVSRTVKRSDYAAWTDSDLAAVRDQSRDLFRRNPFAIGAGRNRVNYCIDLGLRYKVDPQPGVNKDAPVVQEAQKFVDAFIEANNLSEVEAEAVLRGDRDGDFLIRIFPGDLPEVRFVEPEAVYTPDAERLSEPLAGSVVSLGVKHKADDRGTVEGFYVDEELVSESEIVHGRFNADSSFVRGIPLFDPIDNTLRECSDLWRSMSSTTKARAKIAMLWKLKQMSKRTEDELGKRLLEGEQTNERGERNTVNIEQYPYGAVLRYNAQNTESIEFPNLNAGSTDGIAVMMEGLKACGASVCMPAWMFTNTADEKYANAFVNEAPALKSFRRHQRAICQLFGEGRLGTRASLVWRAIRLAVESGTLVPETLTAVKVTCTPPALEVRNNQELASTNATYNAMGVKSGETIQEELGLDPTKEKQRISVERESGLSAAFKLAVIQQQDGAGGMPAGGALPPTGPTGAGGGLTLSNPAIAAAPDVADQALNGAQIASLLSITDKLTLKQLPPEAARAIIKAAFPTLSQQLVEQILASLANFTPQTTPTGAAH